jgi:hypothetical protein
MSGAGAAVAGAAAIVPSVAEPRTPKVHGDGPLVAYIEDIRSDRVTVMAGDTEVVVHNRDLVARLAAQRATTGKREA